MTEVFAENDMISCSHWIVVVSQKEIKVLLKQAEGPWAAKNYCYRTPPMVF